MSKKINTAELDFEEIKTNLKTFLQGQSEFEDYDFDGSALSVLLDVLAYNTHYNALYHNLAINESFIDSASKRNSVVSKANELGYIPSSAISSKATVSLVFNNPSFTAPEYIELPKYTPFSSSIDGNSYTFLTTSQHIAYKNNGNYTFNNIELIEGTLLTYNFQYVPGSRYILPNDSIDISTIEVSVQETVNSSNIETFKRASSIVNLNETSSAFFIREIEDNKHEIVFGNGIIGKELVEGNVIRVKYITSNKTLSNGARKFTFAGTVPTNTTVFVSTIKSAIGGSEPEDIESIRYFAPKTFTAQNRLVTAEDYKNIILSMYPNIRTINVWGGENNTPPIYGKVFMSIVLKEQSFTDVIKKYILDEIINPRKTLTTVVEFVEPEFIDIRLNTTIYYNPDLTNFTSNELVSSVKETIMNYQYNDLSLFGSKFKFSKLSKLIDETEPSIISNITTVRILYNIPVIYNSKNRYNINFNNPIYKSVSDISVLSTGIYTSESDKICYIKDIPSTETMQLYYYDGNTHVKIRDVGTIDYENGIISLYDLNITGLYKSNFKFSIKASSNDIVSVNNQILNIKEELLTITPIIETNKSYKFVSSRS